MPPFRPTGRARGSEVDSPQHVLSRIHGAGKRSVSWMVLSISRARVDGLVPVRPGTAFPDPSVRATRRPRWDGACGDKHGAHARDQVWIGLARGFPASRDVAADETHPGVGQKVPVRSRMRSMESSCGSRVKPRRPMSTTAEPETTDQPEEAPEPHEMFARTRAEGERRLQRSSLELTTTSLVAGFDVVFGVIALAAATAAMTPHFGRARGTSSGRSPSGARSSSSSSDARSSSRELPRPRDGVATRRAVQAQARSCGRSHRS